MRDISIFCEDSFHENFVGAMLHRFGLDYGVAISCRFLSSRGGLPKMQTEFKEFLRDLGRERIAPPDCILAVLDANCAGYNERKGIMDRVLETFPRFQQIVSYAIPDPHIERWMLVDDMAFQAVFGRGCTLPALKCAKNEYKQLLAKEIRDSGVEPLLGGAEFAEDIVNKMNIGRAEVREASLGLFLRALKMLFNTWSNRAPQRDQ